MLIHHQLNLHLRPLSDEFNFWSSGTETWHYESPRPLITHVEQHTRSQIIADGRKQMMEMISNLPESSYELSLKDIVEDDQVKDIHEVEKKKKKKKKKKMGKEIVRISSMETEGLLIKSFFPTSSFKRSQKVATCSCSSKVVPDHSSSQKPDQIKKCWVDRIFKDRSRSGKLGHRLSRWFKGSDDTLPSCWLLFHLKKCKNKSEQKDEEGVVNTVLKC